MGNFWTIEKALELAPDPASAKAARGLTSPAKWSGLGQTERAVWGLCKGSGQSPYQARIDLQGPAFKCSCPSRKFPCKHGLALLMLYANEQKAFKETSPPGWVTDWIEGRDGRSEKKEQKTAQAGPPDPAAQAKRIEKREDKIRAGLDELSLWLADLVRQGLAWAQSQGPSYWGAMAARLVDAQAPGLAGRVRRMNEIVLSGQDWQENLMRQIGTTVLLIEAYRRLETLDPDLRDEVRALVGWTTSKEDLLAQPGVRDRWVVLAQRIEQQERLEVQRTWLWGSQSRRFALILDFAVGDAVLDKSLVVGTTLEAELVYYPGPAGLRALIRERSGAIEPVAVIEVRQTVGELHDAYAQRLAATPWTESVPVLLGPLRIRPEKTGERWYAIDAEENLVPLAPRLPQGWHLLAASGGGDMTVFGEWDGQTLRPMSMQQGKRFFTVTETPTAGLRRVV